MAELERKNHDGIKQWSLTVVNNFMSDKVIRHYSRPYGDCRADKRLYFGGSWPWQQGAECEIPPLSINGPRKIILASDGNFYITSITDAKLFKVTPQGVASIASDAMATPYSLVQATDGNIYICSNDDIYKYIFDSTATIFNSSATSPGNIMCAADTNIYCKGSGGKIWKVTLGGVGTNIATLGGSIGQIVQKGSDLYFYKSVTPGTNAVYKCTTSGTTTLLYSTAHDLSTGGSAILHSNGNIYFTSAKTEKMFVLEFSGDTPTGFTEFATLESTGMVSMIAHSDGNFYITNNVNGNLWKVTTAGVATIIATDLGQADGVVEGADHNIYVCGNNLNTVWKVTTAGVKTKFVP